MEYFLNKFLLLIVLASLLAGKDVPEYRIKPLWMAAAPLCLLLLVPSWYSLFASSRMTEAAREHQRLGDMDQAEELYKSAASIDPTNAECYWALSQLSLEKYRATGSPQALSDSRNYLREGLRYKKDIRFIGEGAF
jgi:tetratricopeptide (TPR) repeat protein